MATTAAVRQSIVSHARGCQIWLRPWPHLTTLGAEKPPFYAVSRRSGGGGIRNLAGRNRPERFSRPLSTSLFAGIFGVVRQCVRQPSRPVRTWGAKRFVAAVALSRLLRRKHRYNQTSIILGSTGIPVSGALAGTRWAPGGSPARASGSVAWRLLAPGCTDS